LVLSKLIIPKQSQPILAVKSQIKKCSSAPSLVGLNQPQSTTTYRFFKIHIQELPRELLYLVLEYLDQTCLVNRISILNRFFNEFVLKNPMTCVQIWNNRHVFFGNDKKNEFWLNFYPNRIGGAIQFIQNCKISHQRFSYLSPEHLGLVLQLTHTYLKQIHIQWCEGDCESMMMMDDDTCQNIDEEEYDNAPAAPQVINNKDSLPSLLDVNNTSNVSFPMLERIKMEYYQHGDGQEATPVEQLLKRVISRAPKLKHLDGIHMSMNQYDHLSVNWNELSSLTALGDEESDGTTDMTHLETISSKLSSNLQTLDLKAQYLPPDQVRKILSHTCDKLTKLHVEDLLPGNMNGIKLDNVLEMSVCRSERALCNLLKSMANLNKLSLDRGSSYEVLSAAPYLKNLKHLTIERYGSSLVQIMKQCSLESLQVSHMDMDSSVLNCLVARGQSLTFLKMDHIKFANSSQVDALFGQLKNLKFVEMNVCHTASTSGPTEAVQQNGRYGVSNFYYGRSRMGLDVASFATPKLESLTYQKAMREKTCGIRMDEFHYVTQNCPKLKEIDISLFDVSFTPNPSATKFNIFSDLDTCHLTFGEYASLAHMCSVLVCCRNAIHFAVDSITCKAAYIDALRARLMNEINMAAIKTARPLTPVTPKKLKRGCEQRVPKPKKSTHSRKGTCSLKHLAAILWSEMDEHVFGPYQFFENGRNVTEELRKHYRSELTTRFNPKQSRRSTSLLHQFLHVLQMRVLSTDIPKKMLIYGPTL